MQNLLSYFPKWLDQLATSNLSELFLLNFLHQSSLKKDLAAFHLGEENENKTEPSIFRFTTQ